MQYEIIMMAHSYFSHSSLYGIPYSADHDDDDGKKGMIHKKEKHVNTNLGRGYRTSD